MIDSNLNVLTVAAALAGAVSIASFATSTPAMAEDMQQCYGVAAAQENACAPSGAVDYPEDRHSCSGQSSISYHGADWKLVPAGTCEDMGGSLEPFEGFNPNPPA